MEINLMKNSELARKQIGVAKYVAATCLVVITVTAYQNKFYDVALLLAPLGGVIAYSSVIWLWKTEKKWLSGIPIVVWSILGSQSAMYGGLSWGLPQMLAIGFLFHYSILWVTGNALVTWLENDSS